MSCRRILVNPLECPQVSGAPVWGLTNTEYYYLKQDEAKRPYQVWRHKVGNMQAEDELLFQEDDELFWVDIYKSQDGNYVFCMTASSETTEVRYLL